MKYITIHLKKNIFKNYLINFNNNNQSIIIACISTFYLNIFLPFQIVYITTIPLYLEYKQLIHDNVLTLYIIIRV